MCRFIKGINQRPTIASDQELEQAYQGNQGLEKKFEDVVATYLVLETTTAAEFDPPRSVCMLEAGPRTLDSFWDPNSQVQWWGLPIFAR
jgi:hypothetical protein